MHQRSTSNLRRALYAAFVFVAVLAQIVPAHAAPYEKPGSPPAETAPQTAPYLWGLIGNDGTHLIDEHAAGIRVKVLRVSWREYYPAEGTVDTNYVARKQAELAELRAAGFDVILSLGYHDTPTWLHANYPDSYYVNQYGRPYTGDGPIDNGDANLVFNPVLRNLVAAYLQRVFADLGVNFAAVRLGGGRWGELTYPPATYNNVGNNYWAFDANALAGSPVPAWRPGQPSPNGEAAAFLNWYHGALVNYQNWQISAVRQSYAGPLMMLYPSWGIRPGQNELAIAGNLSGATSAEINGEIQRGYDFARQINALNDPAVIITTTWLDADSSQDGGSDQRYWSPVHYLAILAHAHSPNLALYGENTGQGSLAVLQHSAAQMQRYGLNGMAWYREEELYSGQYANLDDYRHTIAAYAPSAFRAYLPLYSR
jgi:hypothetical protein